MAEPARLEGTCQGLLPETELEFVVRNLCFKGAVKETTSVVPRIQSRLRTLARRERTALATLAEMTDE